MFGSLRCSVTDLYNFSKVHFSIMLLHLTYLALLMANAQCSKIGCQASSTAHTKGRQLWEVFIPYNFLQSSQSSVQLVGHHKITTTEAPLVLKFARVFLRAPILPDSDTYRLLRLHPCNSGRINFDLEGLVGDSCYVRECLCTGMRDSII